LDEIKRGLQLESFAKECLVRNAARPNADDNRGA